MMTIELLSLGFEEIQRSQTPAIAAEGLLHLGSMLDMIRHPISAGVITTDHSGTEIERRFSWDGVSDQLDRLCDGGYAEIWIEVFGGPERDARITTEVVAPRAIATSQQAPVVAGSLKHTIRFGTGEPRAVYAEGLRLLTDAATRLPASCGRVSTQNMPVLTKVGPMFPWSPETYDAVSDRRLLDASWAVLLGDGHARQLGGFDVLARSGNSTEIRNASGSRMALILATDDPLDYDVANRKRWMEFLAPILVVLDSRPVT